MSTIVWTGQRVESCRGAPSGVDSWLQYRAPAERRSKDQRDRWGGHGAADAGATVSMLRASAVCASTCAGLHGNLRWRCARNINFALV